MSINSMQQFVVNVQKWGEDRGFYDANDGTSEQAQFVKLAEELGELAGAIARGKPIEDHMGDMLVVMVHICTLQNTDLRACAAVAWDEIKDRKGHMSHGVFIKEE